MDTAPAVNVKVEQTVVNAEEVSDDVMLNFFMQPTNVLSSLDFTRYMSRKSIPGVFFIPGNLGTKNSGNPGRPGMDSLYMSCRQFIVALCE